MWSQWTAGPPSIPHPIVTNPQMPLMGEAQPHEESTNIPDPINASSAIAAAATGYPATAAYTPAQFAAMTPEQQYAIQQHWQQWQIYEQQYAQWHAQYGEQYKREMAAMQGGGQPTYDLASTQAGIQKPYSFPPPVLSAPFQTPQPVLSTPPLPAPDDKSNYVGIKAAPHIYEKPPPPPPPVEEESAETEFQPKFTDPQQYEMSAPNLSGNSQFNDYSTNTWSNPPPTGKPTKNRWGENASGPGDRNNDEQQRNDVPDRQPRYNNDNNSQRDKYQGNQPRDRMRDSQRRGNNSDDNRDVGDYRNRRRFGNNNYDTDSRGPPKDIDNRDNRKNQPRQLSNFNRQGNYGRGFDNYDGNNQNQNAIGRKNGPPVWNTNNNNNNQNYESYSNNQSQSDYNQSNPQNNNQKSSKDQNSSALDESVFDEQFKMWENQFENWKRANINHPDRDMYLQYEREFEKTRVGLLERREQMRRRKEMEQQRSNQGQQASSQQQLESSNLNNNKEANPENLDNTNPQTGSVPLAPLQDSTPTEQHQGESDTPVLSNEEESSISEQGGTEKISKETSDDADTQKGHDITDIFKPTDGIPGLDLVVAQVANEPNPDAPPKKSSIEIIDLDNDGPSRPPKMPNILTNPGMEQQQPNLMSNPQPMKKKIPSLFDIVVEKPDNIPDLRKPPGKQPRKEIPSHTDNSTNANRDSDFFAVLGNSSGPQGCPPVNHQLIENNLRAIRNSVSNQQNNPDQNSGQNLPPQIFDIVRALQDPNTMQLLTVALAQVQGGALGDNPEQNKLIQQLQQLQPLLNFRNEGLSNNQEQQQSQQQHQQPQQQKQQQQQQQPQQPPPPQPQQQPPPQQQQQPPPPQQQQSPPPPPQQQQQQQQRNITTPHRRPNPWQHQNQSQRQNQDQSFNKNFSERNLFKKQVDEPILKHDNRGAVNETDVSQDNESRPKFNPFRRNATGPDEGNKAQSSSSDINTKEPLRYNPFQGPRPGNALSPGGLTPNQPDRGDDMAENTRFRNDGDRPYANFGSSLGFRNFPTKFGGRECDNDYYRPAQVFDYRNNSRAEVKTSNIVDYGHRPSTVSSASSFDCDKSEFVPVKTIDYGHASNMAANENKNVGKTNISFECDQDERINMNKISCSQISISDEENNFKLNVKNNEQLNKQFEQTQNKNQLNMFGIDQDNQEGFYQSMQNDQVIDYKDDDDMFYSIINPDAKKRSETPPPPPIKKGKMQFDLTSFEAPVPPVIELDNEDNEGNFEEISENEDHAENEPVTNPAVANRPKIHVKPLFPSASFGLPPKQEVVLPSVENNNTIPIDEILFEPGRLSRPKNIVIIIRGPPGSGKSYVAKLIKDKEVEMGGPTPRLLSIDDYFMVENDYDEKCPTTGRKVPKKEILYEYDKDMESTYMQYLIKSFKKTLADHLFELVIVDCCNHSLRTFNEFYNAARDYNFTPFVIDMKCDLEICLNQNVHDRAEEDIKEIIKNYQVCPGHYIKLDISALLENVVEMEDVSDLEENLAADIMKRKLIEEEESETDGPLLKSKWDTIPTTQNLARLDGTNRPISKRGSTTIEEYLQMEGWEQQTFDTNGKKRVRWADIEERRAQDKMRAIGFVVGQTDWNRMMDPTTGSAALTKTKYIAKCSKR